MNPLFRPAPRLKNPRLFGLLLLGCGVVLNALNAYESIQRGKYYAVALLIGPFACLFGLWRIAIGQPWNETTNRMRGWVLIGDSVAAVIGLSISIALLGLFNGWW